MDFRQLHYISTVAEHRSITKAAKALYISQPSLSHFIAKTEQELGGKLFDRSTTPLSLTYAGERYLETAREILRLSKEVSKEFRDISQNIKGRICIGFPRERAAFMLPLILPEFRRRFPGIQVEIFEGPSVELLDAMQKGKTDFIIHPSHVKDMSAFEYETICEEELLLVAKKGTITPDLLLDGNSRVVDLSKLKDPSFIVLKKGQASRECADLLFKTFRVKPKIVLETTGNLGAYRMAASGLGMAIVPSIAVAMSKSEEEPDIFSLSDHPVTWEVRAVYRKDAYIGVPEKAFFEIARGATKPFSNYYDSGLQQGLSR